MRARAGVTRDTNPSVSGRPSLTLRVSIGCFLLLAWPNGVRQDPPPKVAAVTIEQRLNEPVPLDLVRDEDGQAVTLGHYFDGKPVILVLAYYRCPRLCSLVSTNWSRSRATWNTRSGNQFAVVVVSIDPKEGPELAKAKKAPTSKPTGRPGAGPGWHFLTGEEPAIQRLAAAVGFRYFWDEENRTIRPRQRHHGVDATGQTRPLLLRPGLSVRSAIRPGGRGGTADWLRR